MDETDVLVVGAGPTGLVLALWLARLGLRPRVVDRSPTAATTSRAVAVAAHTLELYQQVGLAERVLARALAVPGVSFWYGDERLARAPVGEMGRGLSPFPSVYMYPQDEHERMLVAELERLGVTVERSRSVTAIATGDDGLPVATIAGADGTTTRCRARYLAGCDGAHSAVRRALGDRFAGGTYDHLFYVADVRARGPVIDGEIHVALQEGDFLAVFPLAGAGHARLIGTMRVEHAEDAAAVGWDGVSQRVLAQLHLEVDQVRWFSTYRVHHRVAEQFSSGRLFLLGDAAHVHSPVGGQGMNTGIGDAVNLSWKLAAALRGDGDERLLASYAPERMAFAERLVKTTDRLFQLIVSERHGAGLVRQALPRLLAKLLRFASLRRRLFRIVSQIGIDYRHSSLSAGHAGRVRGGDRLPWLDPAGGGDDNFAPLTALAWQAHVYGEPSAELRATCATLALPLHAWPWRPAMATAGLARDAVYVVRPDGHVALAEPHGRGDAVAGYFAARGLRPSG